MSLSVNQAWEKYNIGNITTNTVGSWVPATDTTDNTDNSEWIKGWNVIIIDDVPAEPELPEGVERMYLYRVWLIYAEDRKNPVVSRMSEVVAKDEEDAKVKSCVYREVNPDWDNDYMTIFAEEICPVQVKKKPTEVKNI